MLSSLHSQLCPSQYLSCFFHSPAPLNHFLPIHVSDLVMQCQEGYRRVNCLTAFSTQTNHLQSGLMDLLRQLIYSYITRSTD